MNSSRAAIQALKQFIDTLDDPNELDNPDEEAPLVFIIEDTMRLMQRIHILDEYQHGRAGLSELVAYTMQGENWV